MARLVSYCEAGSWVGVTAPALSSVVWACARVGVEQLTDITIDASHPFMSMDFSSLNEKSMARLIHGALQLYNGKVAPSADRLVDISGTVANLVEYREVGTSPEETGPPYER